MVRLIAIYRQPTDPDAFDAALASQPGRASGRDLRSFARAGVELFVADDDDLLDG